MDRCKTLGFMKSIIVLLARDKVVVITLVVTAIYMALILAVKETDASESLLTLILISDPIVVSLIFTGLQLISHRNTGTLQAMAVSPISARSYLLAVVIPLTLLGAISASMVYFASGVDDKYFLFGVYAVIASAQSAFIGWWVACYTDEFMKFVFRVIPVFLLSTLIFVKLLSALPVDILWIMPFVGAQDLIVASYREGYSVWSEWLSLAVSLVWCAVLYRLSLSSFTSKVFKRW